VERLLSEVRKHTLFQSLFLIALGSASFDGLAAGSLSGHAPPPAARTTSDERLRTATALHRVFPVVRFEEAEFEEVISFLSREADINIVIDPAVYASAGARLDSPAARTEAPVSDSTSHPAPKLADAPSTDAPPASGPGRITIRLKNVPLKDVLKYVLRFKNLRYIVDEYAIVIVPVGWVPREQLITKVFRLRTGGFQSPAFMRQQPTQPF
jgi:hypothetical protein